VVLCSDVDTPGDVMVLDSEAGLLPLTAFNPYFAGLATPRARVMTVSDRYGREVRARVYVPERCAAQGRCPVVVHIYGTTGFPRGGNGDEWPFLELLRRGFVVIDADPPVDDIDYSNAGTAEAQRKYVDGPVSGAVALVDALAVEGIVDPERAGIVGLSFGAMVASWAALKTDRFAASSSAGIDLYYATQGLVNGTYEPFLLTAIERGDGDSVLEYLGMDVAPTARAAMLSHEPEEEYRAFLPLIGLLRAFGRPVEQIVYAEEGHVKTQPRNRLEIYRRNVQWFDFWLADREDADPVDPAQYERWRAMRASRDRPPG
jgi:dipeptidyl aminopeptidase/acylaminoacyl peptidase